MATDSPPQGLRPRPDNASDAPAWHRAFRLWTPAVAGALLVSLSAVFGPAWVPLAIIGAMLGLELGGTAHWWMRRSEVESLPDAVTTALQLSREKELFEHYKEVGWSLHQVGCRSDPIFRRLALARLGKLAAEFRELATGQITYDDTETWRLAYEQILRDVGIHTYRSVAWVKNDGYWSDEPGRKSMRLNIELQWNDRVTIERIVILPRELWPDTEFLPVEPVRNWLFEQHRAKIDVRLVREADLIAEPELIADMGIYGSRAMGVQELDSACRTVRFTLSFDFKDILTAEERWNRLDVYATPLADLLRQEKLANLN